MKTDGTSRGTLISDYVEAAEFATSLNTGGRALAAVQTLSSLAVSAGDRIVVEIGYRATNSVSTSFTGTLAYGGTADEGVTEGDAGQLGNLNGNNVASWIQFVSGITLTPPDVRVSQIVAEVVTAPPSYVRVSQLVAEVVMPAPPAVGLRGQAVVAN